MHENAPAALTRGLSSAQASEVTQWWRRLASADREALFTPRRHLAIVGHFVEPGEASRSAKRVASRVGSGGVGAGAPDDEADDGFDVDLYEYVVNHELAFIEERTFHICAAHRAAREAVARGRIPASFRCPNADARCPMRVLLDSSPGHDVKLTVGVPDAASTMTRRR